jgi:uncharacterized protein (DUF2249 family)
LTFINDHRVERANVQGVRTTETIEVDARGREPPGPMVRILEALAALPNGAQLRARTDRRPLHLHPQLEARGFRGITEEHAEGGYVTHIERI